MNYVLKLNFPCFGSLITCFFLFVKKKLFAYHFFPKNAGALVGRLLLAPYPEFTLAEM